MRYDTRHTHSYFDVGSDDRGLYNRVTHINIQHESTWVIVDRATKSTHFLVVRLRI